MASAADVLARGAAADVRALDAQTIAALLPALRDAQGEVTRELAVWLSRLTPLQADEKFSVAQLRQVQLLLGVAEGQGRTRRGGFPTAAAHAVQQVMQQQQAPRRAARTLVAQLETLQAHHRDLPTPQLLHAAILARGDRMVATRYPASAARYAGQVRQDLQHQFAVGLSRGETVNQLATRIASLSSFRHVVDASHPQHAAAAMGAGLTRRYQVWAQRLARTEVMNAYNYTAREGVRAAAKIDPSIKLRWDSSNDAKVCLRCAHLHGEEINPSGRFSDGLEHPPDHPNCRCTVHATSPAIADESDVPLDAEKVLQEELDRVLAQHGEAEAQRAEQVAEVKAERPARRERAPRVDPQVREAQRAARRLEQQQERDRRRRQREIEAEVRREQRAELAAQRKVDAEKTRALRRMKGVERDHVEAVKVVDAHKRSEMATEFHHSFVDPDGLVTEKLKADFLNHNVRWLGRPISLEEMTHGFAPPPGYEMHLRELKPGAVGFNIVESSSGKTVGTLRREFGRDSHAAPSFMHHDLLKLEPEFQGSKIGDTIMRNALPRYEKWGIEEVRVTSAWVGRYAWARMGFNFDTGEKPVKWLDNYITRNPALEPFRAELMTTMDKLKREPWKLAKWDFKGMRFPDEYNPKHGKQWDDDGKRIKYPDLPLGKAFLLSSSTPVWDGTMKVDRENFGYLTALRQVGVRKE